MEDNKRNELWMRLRVSAEREGTGSEQKFDGRPMHQVNLEPDDLQVLQIVLLDTLVTFSASQNENRSLKQRVPEKTMRQRSPSEPTLIGCSRFKTIADTLLPFSELSETRAQENRATHSCPGRFRDLSGFYQRQEGL